ncbi:hypothetical protein [Dendrosporobacter sp. 1207_IL3150]|uniref:hypothetical protein n=1 Tax=Dendrosporobacter sp. 1207_IL3150 TaxID=3084054 RepID=UPI002FD8D712
MNCHIVTTNGDIDNNSEGQNFAQSTLDTLKRKKQRIVIVIEDGRVVKYIQKNIQKF